MIHHTKNLVQKRTSPFQEVVFRTEKNSTDLYACGVVIKQRLGDPAIIRYNPLRPVILRPYLSVGLPFLCLSMIIYENINDDIYNIASIFVIFCVSISSG